MQGIAEHAKWHKLRSAHLFQKVIWWSLGAPPFVHYQIRCFRKFLFISMASQEKSQFRLSALITMLTCLLFFYFPNFIFVVLLFSWDLDHISLFFPWFSVVSHRVTITQSTAGYHDQLPLPVLLLTDTHKWMKKKHGNNNGHMKRIISITWWWRTLAFLLIPFVKTFFFWFAYCIL